jgi:hypothetical protein
MPKKVAVSDVSTHTAAVSADEQSNHPYYCNIM